MNLSRKLPTLIGFLLLFVALPYGAYKLYYYYQDGLYMKLKEYTTYETKDNKYTVAIMDSNEYGDQDVIKMKIYLVNNSTKEAHYIGRFKFREYADNAITFTEKKGTYLEVTVTYDDVEGKSKIVINCNEGKQVKDKAA